MAHLQKYLVQKRQMEAKYISKRTSRNNYLFQTDM